jgi:SAM-dependent methyltransferase
MNFMNPVRRFFWLRCIAYCADDIIKGLRFRLGNIGTRSGAVHSTMSPTESVGYIENVFGSYKRAFNVSRFKGRIAEVGPGDNCGIGLLFVAEGTESVDLLDRFYSHRDKGKQAGIYRLLMERHKGVADILDDRNLEDDETFPGIRRHYGSTASAEYYFPRNPNTYDFIVSCAVLEHVADVEVALDGMIGSLKPGGEMVHFVDLRDHAMFSYRWHELKFLEVPEILYRRMVLNSGRPNRRLLPAYRSMLSRIPVESEIRVTWLAGIGKIDPPLPYDEVPAAQRRDSLAFVRSVRAGFDEQFKGYSDEELSVTSFVLRVRKPFVSRAGT